MDSIQLDNLLSDDQILQEMREKETRYHEVFQQLSTTRTDYRRVKHDHQLVKTQLIGMQQELQTLRDILRQKKSIINDMRSQIEEKSAQLNSLEGQLNQLGKDKQELVSRLDDKLNEIRDLRSNQHQNKKSIATMKSQVDSINQFMTEMQSEYSLVLSQIQAYQREQKDLTRLLSRVPELQKSQNNSAEAKVKSLVHMTTSQQIDNQILCKKVESLQMRVSESESTANSYSFSLGKKEQQLNILRLQSARDKSSVEQLCDSISHQLLDKQATIKEMNDRLSRLTVQHAKSLHNIETLEEKVASLEKESVHSVIPLVRAVLGEELSNLVVKYVQLGNHESAIIGNEIDRQCSLLIYNHNRQSQVDVANNQLRNRVVQVQQENDILMIRISNLERAYEHAIDDYRRSLRFKAICQPSKPQSVFKENLSTNY